VLKIGSPIVYTDIYNIVPLAKGHPVFKLEGWGDDHGKIDAIVVKMESMSANATSAHRRDVRVATGMMNVIDPSARTHVLDRAEVEQLKMYADGGNVADQDGLMAANELKRLLADPKGVWTKMEVKQLLGLDGALKKRLAGDKADVRAIAAALKKSGGLEKLGQIIAVDLFNGNNDRFDFLGGIKADGLPERFKVIRNLGNVLVACGANGRGEPIGLDSYDPNNEFREMNTALNQQSDWGGLLLTAAKTAERNRFVEGVISDLEMALGPRNRKIAFASKKRLGSNRKERLLNGMLSGKNIIQRTLVPLKAKPNLSPGLRTRIALMGW
jgi:hypothetical protein